MVAVALALSLSASPACPATDARAELLSLHEAARQAHLRGDAALIARTIGDRLLLAEKGRIDVQTNAEVAQFFTGYFSRVRYREWRDASPPVVAISPDGQLAWMAVEVEARYALAEKPAEAEKNFKSSWIATYERKNCKWRMIGIASNVVE